MKRHIATAIAVIGVLLLPYPRAFAQAPCSSLNPFLYKVEKNGKTSFMLGTMHIGIALSAYPQAVYSTFENSAVTAFEDDPDEIKKELGPKIRERSKLPPGQTLRDVISATSIQKLESLYGKKTAARVMRYRPWAVKDKIDQASRKMEDVDVRSRAITKKLRDVEELPSNPQPFLRDLLPNEDDEDVRQ